MNEIAAVDNSWAKYILDHAYWRYGKKITQDTRDTTRVFSVQVPCRRICDDSLLTLFLFTMMSPKVAIQYKSNNITNKNMTVCLVSARDHDDYVGTITKTKTKSWFELVWGQIGRDLIIHRFLRPASFNKQVITMKEIAIIEKDDQLLDYLEERMYTQFVVPINRYLTNKSKYTVNPLTGVSAEVAFINLTVPSDESIAEMQLHTKTKFVEAHSVRLHDVLNNNLRMRMDTSMHMVLLQILNSDEFSNMLSISSSE